MMQSVREDEKMIAIRVSTDRTDPIYPYALKRAHDILIKAGARPDRSFYDDSGFGFIFQGCSALSGGQPAVKTLALLESEPAFRLVQVEMMHGEDRKRLPVPSAKPDTGQDGTEDKSTAVDSFSCHVFSLPFYQALANMAEAALFAELCRPYGFGSVTLRDTGSHTDMTVAMMLDSIDLIRDTIAALTEDIASDFTLLRQAGRKLEGKLLEASGGVNTYKGALFSFLVIIGAVTSRRKALLNAAKPAVYARTLQQAVKEFAAPLDADYDTEAKTPGRRSFEKYGQPGARELALSGYENLLLDWWPRFRQGRDISLLIPKILSETWDTTTISRGGFGMLMTLRQIALGSQSLDDQKMLSDWCVRHSLSTGGSADLIALLYFIDLFERFRGLITC
jgi:triphosphoribosyl-dephospho-CoA synthetase